jgi:uncharacterized membrane protein (Fun14 family)
MMIDQTHLISSVFPLVGGGAIGFGVGYVIKKLMKLAFIGLGLVMLVLGFLEYKHWISVNWTVAENQSSAIMTHFANRIAAVTEHMNHEIPIGMSLLGFAPGVLLGFYKG